ncbi:MAG: hypothetical protein AB7G93_19140 [Bdellovibrionales bacterium]
MLRLSRVMVFIAALISLLYSPLSLARLHPDSLHERKMNLFLPRGPQDSCEVIIVKTFSLGAMTELAISEGYLGLTEPFARFLEELGEISDCEDILGAYQKMKSHPDILQFIKDHMEPSTRDMNGFWKTKTGQEILEEGLKDYRSDDPK